MRALREWFNHLVEREVVAWRKILEIAKIQAN